MGIIGKKIYQDINVLDAARERMVALYREYDRVILNLSGGKDSTAMVYLALEVATALNKPIDVLYVDCEIEPDGTIDLCNYVRQLPGVNMTWLAVPISMRNACSHDYPLWFPWNPLEKDLWVRDIPPFATTHMENHIWEVDENYKHPEGLPFMAGAVKKWQSFQDIADQYQRNLRIKGIKACSMIGLRAAESQARFSVMARKREEHYLTVSNDIVFAYPLYDWTATDIWKYIRDTGHAYNTDYELQNKTSRHNKFEKQRVGSIFGEESLRTLMEWPELAPSFWHKILYRVEGVQTAWRYCNDGIYSGGKVEKEANVTYKAYLDALLPRLGDSIRPYVVKQVNKIIKYHFNQTDAPIADRDKEANPLTGISWEFLCKVAIRGDTKDRMLQKLPSLSRIARDRAKLTRDQAVIKYGKDEYKRKYFTARRQSNADQPGSVVTPGQVSPQ